MPAKDSGFTTINLKPEARDALRAFNYLVIGQLRRRVTLTDALLAALAVAEQHMDEVAAAMAADEGEGEGTTT